MCEAHVHVRPHINNIDYFRNGRKFRVMFFYSCFCILISQIRKAYPQVGEKRNLLFSFCGLNMKCPHRLVGLHARSPAVDAIWGGYGTFNWWSSGGGFTSLGAGFGALKPCPVPVLSPSPFPVCGLNTIASPIFLLSCSPLHEQQEQATRTLSPQLAI